MGYRYRLHVRELPGRPDIVFISRKKAVFVHGCLWHQHGCGRYKQPASNVSFWRTKLQKNLERDRRNQRALHRLGWKYRIVWECQVKDVKALRKRLASFLGTS
jgi:DNA mismatch endonuclease, patch repair protein